MQQVHVATINISMYQASTLQRSGEDYTEVQINFKFKLRCFHCILYCAIAWRQKSNLNFIFKFWVVLLLPKDVWHSN